MSSSNYCSLCFTDYNGSQAYHERTTHTPATQVQYKGLHITTLRRQPDGKFACTYCSYTSNNPANIGRHCAQCVAQGIYNDYLLFYAMC